MAEKPDREPSGLMHLELGEGDLTVKLRAREGDVGRVLYRVLYTAGGQRLSIAVTDPDQARALAEAAQRLVDELLNQTGRWPA